jgi:ATP-dependent DNA ligase
MAALDCHGRITDRTVLHSLGWPAGHRLTIARPPAHSPLSHDPERRDPPAPDTWHTSPKWDGFRCLAFNTGGRVILQSRQERTLTRQFPEVVDAVGQLHAEVVLDGELVLWVDGRLNFDALQRRLTPPRQRRDRSPRASYVVFDVLAFGQIDLRSRPYTTRRSILELLLRGIAVPSGLVLTPMSTEQGVVEAWLANHSAAGIEGVVAKRRAQPYRSGRSGWRKIRTRRTLEAVVGGVIRSTRVVPLPGSGRSGR